MAKYIVQHRRGTAEQWDKTDIIPKEGELVIELDEENSLHKLKIGDGVNKYADLAYLQAGEEVITQLLAEVKPRIVTIELTTDWVLVEGEKYKQDIELSDITNHSRLDLQPDVNMLAEFKQLGLVFVTENNEGTISVYSVGNKPSKSYTMQATIVETEADCDKVIGIPIGIGGGTSTGEAGIQIQADWAQMDEAKADYIKNKPSIQYKDAIVIGHSSYDATSETCDVLYNEGDNFVDTFNDAYNLALQSGIKRIEVLSGGYEFKGVATLEQSIDVIGIGMPHFSMHRTFKEQGSFPGSSGGIVSLLPDSYVFFHGGKDGEVYTFENIFVGVNDIAPFDISSGSLILTNIKSEYSPDFGDSGCYPDNICIESCNFVKLRLARASKSRISNSVIEVLTLESRTRENIITGNIITTLLDSGSNNVITNNIIDGVPQTSTGTSITVDDTMSDSSENPVQNKVIKEYIDDNKIGKTTEGGGEIFNDYSSNIASDEFSHAEGASTEASGYGSHSEGHDTKAIEYFSHAEGDGNTSSGWASHSEGKNTTASGEHSHTEGEETIAGALNTHAEGKNTKAYAKGFKLDGELRQVFDNRVVFSIEKTQENIEELSKLVINEDRVTLMLPDDHYPDCGILSMIEDVPHNPFIAIGLNKIKGKRCPTQEALNTAISTDSDKSIMRITSKPDVGTVIIGKNSHAEGWDTRTIGYGAHAEGRDTVVAGNYAHAEGRKSKAHGSSSHAEGYESETFDSHAHAEGYQTKAEAPMSHTEGNQTFAKGTAAHSEGQYNTAEGVAAHAEGSTTYAKENYSHTEGTGTITYGAASHAEGAGTVAGKKTASSGGNGDSGDGGANPDEPDVSIPEGELEFLVGAHAEGIETRAYSRGSHAEGERTEVNGKNGHAEGTQTLCHGEAGHTEGAYTIVGELETSGENAGQHRGNTGNYCHAEGFNTRAVGEICHVEGEGTVAKGKHQHIQGKYNAIDEPNEDYPDGKYAHVVGGGQPEIKDADGKVIQEEIRKDIHTLDWKGNAWFEGKITVGENQEELTTKQDVKNIIEENMDDKIEGLQGKSAYEVALDNGFEGTEEEWLESLQGENVVTSLSSSIVEGVFTLTSQGATGDSGQNGYIPQKGIDYWTPQDIAEIKSYVDAAILGGAW